MPICDFVGTWSMTIGFCGSGVISDGGSTPMFLAANATRRDSTYVGPSVAAKSGSVFANQPRNIKNAAKQPTPAATIQSREVSEARRTATIPRTPSKTTSATVALPIMPCPQFIWESHPNALKPPGFGGIICCIKSISRIPTKAVNNLSQKLQPVRKSLRADSVVRSCGASRAVFGGTELVSGLRARTLRASRSRFDRTKKPSLGLAKHCQ